MPLVVSDSGPLIHLAQINKLQILEELFGCIEVSPSVKVEVVDEGIRRSRPDAEIADKALRDGWIKVESHRRTSETLKRLNLIAQTKTYLHWMNV